jgi:hypothetical protein
MALSKQRSEEIFNLTLRGGESEKDADKFVSSCTNSEELHFFAEHYNWDGDVKPIRRLIKNPNVDGGTLLYLYWYACPEDYYLFHKDAKDVERGYERDVFNVIREIERRIVDGDFRTASVPFDPRPRISMRERHREFAREIPTVMMEPLGM